MDTDGRLCQDCGKPIPAARLKLLPNTTVCAKCRGLREKQAKTPAPRETSEYLTAERERKAAARFKRRYLKEQKDVF